MRKKLLIAIPILLILVAIVATVTKADNPCDRIKNGHIELTGAYAGNAQEAAKSIQDACDKRNHITNGDGSGVLKDSENVKDVEKKKPAKKQTPSQVRPLPDQKPNYTIPKSDSPFVNRLNKIRVKSGLAPFRESDQLSAQAQAWSNNMARNGYRHSGYGGEVIAYSCGGYFEDVLQEWLDSPPHRAIIMGSGNTVGYGQVTKGDCTYYAGLVG